MLICYILLCTIGSVLCANGTSFIRAFALDIKSKEVHGSISSEFVNIYYLPLNQSSELDLYRLKVYLPKWKHYVKDNPGFIQILASNGHSSVTFGLPAKLSNGTLIYETGRLLNPVSKDENGENFVSQYLTIEVATTKKDPVFFTLNLMNYDRAQYVIDFTSKRSSKSLNNQSISFVRPIAYRISIPGASTVALKLTIRSEDELCGLLVLANDDESIYNNRGELGHKKNLVSTLFTKRFDYIIPAGKMTGDFLYTYILLQPDDVLCDPDAAPRELNKKKKLDIAFSTEQEMNYTKPIILVIAAFLVYPIGLGLIAAYRNRRPNPLYTSSVVYEAEHGIHEAETIVDHPPLIYFEQTPEDSPRNSLVIESNVTEPTAEDVANAADRVQISRRAASSLPPDDSCSDDGTGWKTEYLQFAFYAVPGLLFALMQQEEERNANRPEDVCYHNYACAKQLRDWFFSFNHMVSNVGYAIYGLFYLGICLIRMTRKLPNRGVCHNDSMDLCIGIALIGAAIFSSVYHTCPSQTSYHFDTPFIQILCLLIMMKLYGNRHGAVAGEDIHKVISLTLAADFAIYYLDAHHTASILLSIGLLLVVVYAMTKISLGHDMSLVEAIKSPSRFCNVILPSTNDAGPCIVIIGVNAAIMGCYICRYFIVHANQVVTLVCIVNMLMHCAYYYKKKIDYKEKLNEISLLALATSTALHCFALHFFFSETYDWTLTSAQSRALNRDCILLNFFDAHDIWHMLSAMGIFSALISINTIDDAQMTIPRSELKVF